MPSITPAQVRHIAKLARLTLTDAEATRSVQELTAILRFIDMLRDVHTERVQPTAGVTGLRSILREDVLRGQSTSPNALLACSPLPVVRHQMQTPAAHG